MAAAAEDLARYREIAVVLGGGLYDDGRPLPSTLARADAAAELAKTHDIAVIVSGSHSDGPKPARTEAALMADRLVRLGIPRARIFLEEDSRDTASNAAFVAEQYLAKLEPRRLIIVTSPFHMVRSLATFTMVLGPAWQLEGRRSAAVPDDAAHEATEALYLERTRARLRGIEPGDLARISAQLRATMHENVSDEPRRPRY